MVHDTTKGSPLRRPGARAIHLIDHASDVPLWQRPDGWYSRLSQPESRGNVAAIREWQSSDDPRPVLDQVFEYDPRVRPWFTGALERLEELGDNAPLRERVFWTPPYRFYTSNEPGITASLAHRSSTGRIVILGFDILLADISRYTSRLTIGERGRVFVLRGSPEDPEGLAIIGLPADERFDNHEAMLEFVLRPPDDFGGPVASFVESAVGSDDGYEQSARLFSHEGEDWWGGIAPSQLRSSHDIWVGAIVPEQELLAALPNTSLIVILVTVLVLLLAAQRAYRLSARYSEPVEALTEQGSRMQRLNFEPGVSIESDITEIRHLSATLEQMRSALQSFTAEREDIRVAESIRKLGLPADVPAPHGVDVQVWQEPAAEPGGESYDAVIVRTDSAGDPEAVILGLFDFPGKGLAAAIGGVQLRAEFRAVANKDLGVIATKLDHFVREERPELCPLRACLVRIDAEHNIALLNFGWDAPLLRREGDVSKLGHTGNPLGTALGVDPGKPLAISLQVRDLFVLASDGVVDALSVERRRYGTRGLEGALASTAIRDAGTLIDSVAADLEDFTAGVRDDRTILVIHAPEHRA
jgi:serine phosphatase RsbU (regulator of sigma subunit)